MTADESCAACPNCGQRELHAGERITLNDGTYRWYDCDRCGASVQVNAMDQPIDKGADMTKPTTITVWRNNRLDAEETLNLADLAAGFASSSYAAEPMPMERAVSLYLATDQHATWEDRDAFDALCDLIAESRTGADA